MKILQLQLSSPVTEAELQPEIPREVDDLRVEGEGDAETRQ